MGPVPGIDGTRTWTGKDLSLIHIYQEAYVCTVSTLAETAALHNITKTALIIVGDVVTHSSYERSKLYDPEFTTEFRQGRTDGDL